MVMPGCAFISTESNQPPTAAITSISPEVITYGETIQFKGDGIDVDGDVVGYAWRSEQDGELSQAPVFETDSLSVGSHAIYFIVRDDDGDWSAEAQGRVTVTAPLPEPARINAFAASLTAIRAGDIIMLSWNVSDAMVVSIDQGIGAVPLIGTITATPEVTTTYRLTATGASSTATASVTIAVEPVQVVVLEPDADMSGYVRFSGYAPYGEVCVGDDEGNRGIRGFLTYNISSIPEDATIIRVMVDMSGYEIPYEVPFPEMGCLSAFEHYYNSLQSQYKMPGLPGAIEEWCSVDELSLPTGSIGLRNALQQRVGESRFQFRLQFADRQSDGDDTRDFLCWRVAQLPTLTIEYHS